MIGIVYYSKNGNTEIVAELLAEKYHGRVFVLEEKCRRKGLFGFIKSGFQALAKKQSVLLNTPWKELKDYDILYLCTPIWAGNITPAMNTFMANADLTDMEITIVTVQADTQLERSERAQNYLTELVKKKGGIVKKCIGLSGSSPFEKGDRNNIKRQFDTCL